MMKGWEQDGFVVVEDVLPLAARDLVLQAVTAQARKYCPGEAAFAGEAPWRMPAFDAALIKFRQAMPRNFGWLYDTLQTNAAVMGPVHCGLVARIAAELLHDDVSSLSATGAMLRIDVPADTRNRLDWHQERSYYEMNDDGRNGVVVWIALRDVDELAGTIQVRPGSHNEGYIPVGANDETALVSQQYRVPQDVLDRYPPRSLPARAGSGVFFSFHLFHASGANRSERVRFTLGVRFHRATAHDFKPGRLRYTLT